MSLNFFVGFLAARGHPLKLNDNPLKHNDEIAEGVRKFITTLDKQIEDLEARLAKAHQKLTEAGLGDATLGNSADPAMLTPKQAREFLAAEIAKLEAQAGYSYERAHRAVYAMHPGIASMLQRADISLTTDVRSGLEKMNSADKVLANARTVSTPSGFIRLANNNEVPPLPPPADRTDLAFKLGLPPGADPATLELAWKATRGITNPRNSKAIWDALVERSQRGQGHPGMPPMNLPAREVVERRLRNEFPLLAEDVGVFA